MGRRAVRQLVYSRISQLCFWFSGSDTPKGHGVRYCMLRDRMGRRAARRERKKWEVHPNHGGNGWDIYGQKYAAEAQIQGMTKNTFEKYLTKRHKILSMHEWVGFQIPEVLEKGVAWMARELRLDDERRRYDFKSAAMSTGLGRALYRVIAPASYRRYMESGDASSDRHFCTECQKRLLEHCGYNDVEVQQKITELIGQHTFLCLPTHAHPMNMQDFVQANAQFTPVKGFYVGVR